MINNTKQGLKMAEQNELNMAEKVFIKIQNSNATQTREGHIKSDWVIKENITEEVLATLPSSISDQALAQIMKFCKKYELIAFNEGIQLGKKKTKDIYDIQFKQQKNLLMLAATENERLADALEIITGE